MAISFVGYATATNSNSNVLQVDVSSLSAGTLQENDIVIVAAAAGDFSISDGNIICAGNNSGAATELADLFSNDTNDTDLGAYVIVQGATVDTAVNIQFGGSRDSTAAICMVYRGVDTTTPIDVTTITATGIDTAIPDPSAITPSTSGAWIIVAGANASTQGSTTLSHSGLSNVVSVSEAAGSRDVCLGVGNYTSWSSGSYNPAAFTWSGSDAATFSYCAVTIALRPAAGANVDIPVGVESVVYTEYAPTISAPNNKWVLPGLEQITYTEYAPTVLAENDIFLDIGVESVVYTEYAPTVDAQANIWIDVAQESVLYTEYAPTVDAQANVWVDVGTESVLYTEYTPTVDAQNNIWVDVGTESILYTEYAPSMEIDVVVAPGTENVLYTEYAPTISISADQTIQVANESIIYTGLGLVADNPVNVSVNGAESILYTEYAPTVAFDVSVAIGAESILYTEYAPTITQIQRIPVGTESVVYTEYNPFISLGPISIAVGTENIQYTEYAPTLNSSIAVGTESVVYTEYAPTAALGPLTISVGLEQIEYTGLAPTPIQFEAGGSGTNSLITTDTLDISMSVRMV